MVKKEDGLYCSDHRNPGSKPVGWLQAQVSAKSLTRRTLRPLKGEHIRA